MSKPYAMTSPCKNCPFRSDVKAYLRPARVREIRRSLVNAEFPCHKTTEHDEDDDTGKAVHVPTEKEIHCAGALILLEKIGQPSQMMRIAERFGMYDRDALDMDAPVFDSFREMEAAQPRD